MKAGEAGSFPRFTRQTPTADFPMHLEHYVNTLGRRLKARFGERVRKLSVPVSPCSSTAASVGATRSTRDSMRLKRGERPASPFAAGRIDACLRSRRVSTSTCASPRGV
ncbi:hypothetical protein GALL_182520 [mine drainage metagenome]|uniref:Uncharacterized protein n=1 Tax=mine drainage metagenome TaxID=410659 RepID=A0A1J5RVA5_9ZZZZ